MQRQASAYEGGRQARFWDQLAAVEARRAPLWAPVFLGGGVWAYFALRFEPPIWIAAGAFAAAVVLGGLGLRLIYGARAAFAAVSLALALICLGFGAAQMRAHVVGAPVWSAQGPSEVYLLGRVAALGVSSTGARRVTFDMLQIERVPLSKTPRRIRLTLPPKAAFPTIGGRYRLKARLAPPPGPAEPGAFDFRRKAWFDGLGAIGSVRSVLHPAPTPPPSFAEAAWLRLEGARASLAAQARAAAPGRAGAFVAALLVGDRTGVALRDVEALRAANLAHLLAISGLHMGILCFTVFGAARMILALHAGLCARFDTKKIAAICALLAGVAYLALSGAGLATQRAFIMALVAFGAVLAGRSAITLRAVALAATLMLIWRPESLMDVGFQLSFAATTAMVAGFELIRDIRRKHAFSKDKSVFRSAVRPIWLWLGAALLASLIAGAATAPFAAAAFNRLAAYGLAANLAAAPIMGFWIMPCALLGIILAPFGAAHAPLWAMGLGAEYVLAVAHEVAAWPGALKFSPAPAAGAVAMITLGGLWLCLWRGAKLRLLGVAAICAGLVLWRAEPRPSLLISSSGALVGVMTPEGRALNQAYRDLYAAQLWLRRDGDGASPFEAAARKGLAHGAWARLIGGQEVYIADAKRLSAQALAQLCRPGAIIVLRKARGPSDVGHGCYIFDRAMLAREGSVALQAGRIITSRGVTGRRLWAQ